MTFLKAKRAIMVSAGVVNHPSEWSFGGYNEIQSPRRKCALIAYETLAVLAGYQNYNSLRESHIEWVNESLANSNNVRDSRWTRSIAVGSEQFVERIKAGLSIKALGRKIRDWFNSDWALYFSKRCIA